MAYARKRGTPKRRASSRSARVPRRGRSYQRTYSRRAPAKRRRSVSARRSAGSRTVKVVIEQVGPQSLSPLQQALLERGKVVLPRKARF